MAIAECWWWLKTLGLSGGEGDEGFSLETAMKYVQINHLSIGMEKS